MKDREEHPARIDSAGFGSRGLIAMGNYGPHPHARRPGGFIIAAVLIVSLLVSMSTTSLLLRPASASFPGGNDRIAYATGPNPLYNPFPLSRLILSIRPNGASAKLLTPFALGKLGDVLGDPAWSPDGLMIAFDGILNLGVETIFVMKYDGSGLRLLMADGFEPAWSPDGAKIAFASYRTGQAEIYVMNSDGTGQKQLTDTGNNMQPRWSPDGSKIAFVSDRAITHNIYLMNADGTNQIRLTGGPSDYGPDWSPDGSKIVFWKTTFSYLTYIYVINRDGSGLRLLDSYGYEPAWSPDGTKIVFISSGYLFGQILVMNADGSGVSELAFPTFGIEPNWQPWTTPDFYVYVPNPNPFNPRTTVYTVPGSSSSSEIVVNSIGSFSSPVSLSASWVGPAPTGVDFYLPSPAVVTPSPSTGNASLPLTITASSDASTGNYTLQVTGVSGSLSDSFNVTVLVTSTTITATSVPDFYMFPCCFPDVLSVPQGGNDSATINVNPINGFNGPVTFTSSWLGAAPADVSVSFSTFTILPPIGTGANSLLTITAAPTATSGIFVLQVTGASGSLTQAVTVPVQIISPTPTVSTTTTNSTSTTTTSTPEFPEWTLSLLAALAVVSAAVTSSRIVKRLSRKIVLTP